LRRNQSVERHAEAGFEQSVGDGERVVEDCIVGEVAHGEVVELLDRAEVGEAVGVDRFDGQFAGEHKEVAGCRVSVAGYVLFGRRQNLRPSG
jgi:hypothetical protein